MSTSDTIKEIKNKIANLQTGDEIIPTWAGVLLSYCKKFTK